VPQLGKVRSQNVLIAPKMFGWNDFSVRRFTSSSKAYMHCTIRWQSGVDTLLPWLVIFAVNRASLEVSPGSRFLPEKDLGSFSFLAISEDRSRSNCGVANSR